MTTRELPRFEPLLYIGGQWLPATTGQSFAVENPATGEIIAQVADATTMDATRALDAAAAAQESWAATAPRQRGEILRRAFDLLTARREQFAALMTLEMGKPYAEALGEVSYGGEFLRWFSEEAVRIFGRYGHNPEGTGQMIVSHRPVGPCYLITPWNFPLAMATRKIAPAIAAGCTSVIKPAGLTPLTTLAFVALLEEVGLPAGVVNVITTTQSGAVTDTLMVDERLRKVSFTGSTPVGQALIAKAATRVLRTSMELGGNAPFVVFDDADLDKAVDGAMLAKFRNIGEACTAANRFIVHEAVATEFARRVSERVRALRVGNGLDAGVTIGPLIDQRAVASMSDLVDDAVARGATLATGGHVIEGPGNFFAPTVLTNVPAEARMVREEIFGPLLGISSFSTEAEAVRMANATEYGLVGYVFTRDVARAHRLIEQIDTGMMGINTGLVSNAAGPFGGVKMSGLGREGGFEGIHEYLSPKYTVLPVG